MDDAAPFSPIAPAALLEETPAPARAAPLLEPDQGFVTKPLTERVAILEERTAPKPKSLLDQTKDWGGVVSLVIALAYSFPLGVWDRFIVSGASRRAATLATLRQTIDETTSMIAGGARDLSSIADPEFRDMVSRSLTTRLFVKMTEKRAAFLEFKDDFVAPELLVISSNFVLTNQLDAAIPLLETVERNPEADAVTAIEARRMHAKALFLPGTLQNQPRAREIFAEAVAIAAQQVTTSGITSYITVTADWGLLEMLVGDWACGLTQTGVALKACETNAAFLSDRGMLAQIIQQKIAAIQQRVLRPPSPVRRWQARRRSPSVFGRAHIHRRPRGVREALGVASTRTAGLLRDGDRTLGDRPAPAQMLGGEINVPAVTKYGCMAAPKWRGRRGCTRIGSPAPHTRACRRGARVDRTFFDDVSIWRTKHLCRTDYPLVKVDCTREPATLRAHRTPGCCVAKEKAHGRGRH